MVAKDEHSITYRSVESVGEVRAEMIRAKVDTMEKLLLYVVKQFSDKKCLGTRQILAEEDEIQPNGRVFKKVRTRNSSYLSLYLINVFHLLWDCWLGNTNTRCVYVFICKLNPKRCRDKQV